jgi:hypothetical protein
MKDVIDSLPEVRSDFCVFDNGSTQPGTRELLMGSGFGKFFFARRNFGYWSAINWILKQEELLEKYQNIYIIESDAIHYDFQRVSEAEKFLETTADIGSVRLQEFSVTEQHLYDKNNPRPDSRRWAWTRFSNHFTRSPGYLKHESGTIWRTNLAPQVCALNRLSFMKRVFKSLENKSNIAEVDFQREYFDLYKETALLDGGIFNTKTSYLADTMTGSYTDPAKQQVVGYRNTRYDTIENVDEVEILTLNTT